MTIAINRRFRQRKSMIGVGLVAILIVATVVALRLDNRPITVSGDPTPAVQSGALDSVQGAVTAQSLRDVDVHEKWLETVRNGVIEPDPAGNAPTFTEKPGGGLVRSDAVSSPVAETVAAQPGGAGNGFGALPAR